MMAVSFTRVGGGGGGSSSEVPILQQYSHARALSQAALFLVWFVHLFHDTAGMNAVNTSRVFEFIPIVECCY